MNAAMGTCTALLFFGQSTFGVKLNTPYTLVAGVPSGMATKSVATQGSVALVMLVVFMPS